MLSRVLTRCAMESRPICPRGGSRRTCSRTRRPRRSGKTCVLNLSFSTSTRLTSLYPQPLEQLVTALSSASSSDADGIFPVYSVLPDVYASLTLAPAEEDETRAQVGDDSLTLPLVLVPPESDDSDITIGAAVGLEHALPPAPITAGLRGDEGVGYEGTRLTLRLFDDEVCAVRTDLPGSLC